VSESASQQVAALQGCFGVFSAWGKGGKVKPKLAMLVQWVEEATSEEEFARIGRTVREEGYAGFHELLDGIYDRLKRYDEQDSRAVRELLDKAKRIVPDPGEFSPSWDRQWEKVDRFIQYKQQVFTHVPREQREGEWQIIMDNPFTNDQVVCYPSLSFLEAAYLYAYFRDDLQKNEYLRIQKIVSLFEATGEEN
jgi:hypothetical protein